ncbi:MAG: type II secretion system protein [Planctomycetota bacterium]|jgi:general secretion pathway protein G
MSTPHSIRRLRAFTLIEILIVVVILGILAAIVIPQFSDASDDAARSSAQATLSLVREQIELYQFKESTEPTGFADLIAAPSGESYLRSAPGPTGQYTFAWVAGPPADVQCLDGTGADTGW